MSSLKFKMLICPVWFALASAGAHAQQWEVGAGGGASLYNSRTVTGSLGSVDAGFKPGFGGTAWLGQIGDRIGGEIRYSIFKNDLELKSGGASYSRGGRSQAIHYDVLIYTNTKNSKTRPFFLVGGGVKQFTGTGEDVAFQPLGHIAVLTGTSEWKPMLTTGAGVRIAISAKTHLRAEVRGYFTQTPTEVITPVPDATAGGWYFQIVPMISLSYVW